MKNVFVALLLYLIVSGTSSCSATSRSDLLEIRAAENNGVLDVYIVNVDYAGRDVRIEHGFHESGIDYGIRFSFEQRGQACRSCAFDTSRPPPLTVGNTGYVLQAGDIAGRSISLLQVMESYGVPRGCYDMTVHGHGSVSIAGETKPLVLNSDPIHVCK